jgi:hypothetical protein
LPRVVTVEGAVVPVVTAFVTVCVIGNLYCWPDDFVVGVAVCVTVMKCLLPLQVVVVPLTVFELSPLSAAE